MTDKEWQDFRGRVKDLNPNWEKCSCPRRCKANALDENWLYDEDNHVKRFVMAKFICQGCHWLKSPPFRIRTWLEGMSGKLPPLERTPHIIACLGWTESRVEKLREKDLQQHFQETEEISKIQKEVELGVAEVLYWKIDLSALKQYGYSRREITWLESRMRRQAN